VPSALGTVCISIALVRREIIRPLLDRGSQLEAMHDVSLAITSQFNTDTVLNDITAQAATWLNADAACIFLDEGSQLKLVATHKLPATVENIRISFGHGVAGTVVQNNQSVYLENYDRDWAGEDEFPFARSTFGSLICVPLIYNVNVIGALLVISGKQGTLFEREDVHLLELLATQTAVAISHGRLFTDQQNLTTKLKSTNEQLQKVLISTENPVLAVDRRLNLIFTNPAAETLFGLDTIHSRANLQQALPAHAVPKNYKEALRSIKRKGSYSYEIELNNVSYMCQVASLGNRSRVDGFVAVMNDVSELVELDRIKSEMVRMTSHDLKNPLQAAFANLELLNEDIESIDDEEIHLSVGNIETQLNKMFRIISGILDLERVNAGVTLSETCNLNVIIADAVEELDDYARENGIVLRTDIDSQIADFMGDSMQFRRAVINIIENAIKFNSPGGEVLIRAQNRSHDILISISDDGIGIPQAVQSKIFERFFRGHQPGAEHISGSGLGLSLVKAVVESHNGKIWMRSQPNIGTTFNIAVPAIRRPVNAIPN
ncbi:MAG: GAF domain-containing sensor histidine kinase, partial [Chloroflexota bacterium]